MPSQSCSSCTKILNRARCPTPALFAGIETESNGCPWYWRRSYSERVLAVLAEPDETQLELNPFRGLQSCRRAAAGALLAAREKKEQRESL